MKRITIIFVAVLAMAFTANAQNSNVDEAKKVISGLSLTVDSYNKAFTQAGIDQ